MQIKRFSLNVLLLIIAFYNIFPNSSKASSIDSDFQKNDSENYRTFILTQFYSDLSYLISERDFYFLLGGVYAGPAVFEDAFETEANDLGEKWGNSSFADNFFELGEVLGNAKFPAAVSISSWGFGKAFGSEKLQNFGYDMVRTQIINGLVTISLKGIVHRTRPDGAPYSYPSGHTSSAFATAGVVYKNFGKVWGIPAFGLASFVGVSRLQENKHYLSDILAGAVIGTYVSLKLSGNKTEGSSISFVPIYNIDTKGLQVSMKF